MTTPDLPLAFIEQINRQLGPETQDFLASCTETPTYGLRINPAKTSIAELQARTGWTLELIDWCPFGAYVDPGDRTGAHPYHAAGLYYLQEPTAMSVAEAADLRPGMTVLDLAASPGGKATQIASAIGPTGLLVANEIHPARIKPLGENLERWGVTNTIITNRTPDQLASLRPVFDRVVVDAPCSGEGLFRRDPEARLEWSPERVLGSAGRQLEILHAAVRMVRPGGKLIYSTCTFNLTENEHVIERLLTQGASLTLKRTDRYWPHQIRGEGHTVTVLQDSRLSTCDWVDDVSATPYRGDEWRQFADACLTTDPLETWGGVLTEHKGRLSLIPRHPVASALTQSVRSGLWLGDIKPGRFEPSHSLALALDPSIARNRLDLTVEQARRWMTGEPATAPGESGWVLITVNGFSLSWGKRTGTTVKNHYPKGLRRH